MKKNKFSQYFLFVSVLTVSTIFLLIFHKSYNNLVKPRDEVKGNVMLKPFDATIDIDIINEISEKEDLSQ